MDARSPSGFRADIKQRLRRIISRRPVLRNRASASCWSAMIPASAMYVRMKRRACERAGLRSEARITADFETTQAQVESAVRDFNADPNIHGILVQLPLPDHIDEEAVLNEISLAKDVDGIHPMNLGSAGHARARADLHASDADRRDALDRRKRAKVSRASGRSVIGRSNIVGLPVALMLDERQRHGDHLPQPYARSSRHRPAG